MLVQHGQRREEDYNGTHFILRAAASDYGYRERSHSVQLARAALRRRGPLGPASSGARNIRCLTLKARSRHEVPE